jgi:hypothetical protein
MELLKYGGEKSVVEKYHRPGHLSLPVKIGLATGSTVVFTLILGAVIKHSSWTVGLLAAALTVMVLTATATLLALRRVRKHVLILRGIASRETGFAQGPLLYWVEEQLNAIHGGVGALLGGGWNLDKRQYNTFMKNLEDASDDPDSGYTGTTGDVPSVWLDRYPWVVDAEPKTRAKKPCLRFLIVEPEALLEDVKENKDAYEDFLALHERLGIRVHYVDPRKIEALDPERWGRYLTVWQRYAIVSAPSEEKGELVVNTELICEHDRQKFKPLMRYVKDLEKDRPTLQEYLGE